MSVGAGFSSESLRIDAVAEVERISARMREAIGPVMRRRGMVVAISGGIDSSVTLALAVAALGKQRVFALQMPERHSSEDTLGISSRLAEHFGVEHIHEDITPILEAMGFYRRYDDAVRSVVPAYGPGWKSKIVLPNVVAGGGLAFYSVVARSPDGAMTKARLPLDAYLAIVAATNFKQRIRKTLEYYHADRLNYVVSGTPNRLEYDQGFFVKLGDGAADVKPIAHLYKSQVYQLAEHLGVPEEIRRRPPTTDTYSLEQGQDEFYFSLPYARLDLCLYGKNNGVPIEAVAGAAGLSLEQVTYVYKDIDQKRSTTRYLHMSPVLMADVPEITH